MMVVMMMMVMMVMVMVMMVMVMVMMVMVMVMMLMMMTMVARPWRESVIFWLPQFFPGGVKPCVSVCVSLSLSPSRSRSYKERNHLFRRLAQASIGSMSQERSQDRYVLHPLIYESTMTITNTVI
jgi:hypothetical protein